MPKSQSRLGAFLVRILLCHLFFSSLISRSTFQIRLFRSGLAYDRLIPFCFAVAKKAEFLPHNSSALLLASFSGIPMSLQKSFSAQLALMLLFGSCGKTSVNVLLEYTNAHLHWIIWTSFWMASNRHTIFLLAS